MNNLSSINLLIKVFSTIENPWSLEKQPSIGHSFCHLLYRFNISLILSNSKKISGSGGIRTHASEETGALNQRLRPLGHATYYWQQCVHGKLFLALPHLQEQFSWTAYYLNVNTRQNKKVAVRSGIWTHALIRGPEFSIQLPIMRVRYSPWVWRLRPLGHPDRVKLMWKILTSKTNGYIFWAKIKWIFNFWKKHLAERSFDLRTSGLWAQHASTAPLCFYCHIRLISIYYLNGWCNSLKMSLYIQNEAGIFCRNQYTTKTQNLIK